MHVCTHHASQWPSHLLCPPPPGTGHVMQQAYMAACLGNRRGSFLQRHLKYYKTCGPFRETNIYCTQRHKYAEGLTILPLSHCLF